MAFLSAEGHKLQETLQYLFATGWEGSGYYRTEWVPASANPHVVASFGAELASPSRAVSAKVNSLRNVPPDERCFGAAEGGRTQSHVLMLGGRACHSGDVSVAVRSFGTGAVAYFGDVNCEAATLSQVAAFCSRRSSEQPVDMGGCLLPPLVSTAARGGDVFAVPPAVLETAPDGPMRRKSAQLLAVIEATATGFMESLSLTPEHAMALADMREFNSDVCSKRLAVLDHCDHPTCTRPQGVPTTACATCKQVRYCSICAEAQMAAHDCPGEASFQTWENGGFSNAALKAHPVGTKVIMRDHSGRNQGDLHGIICRFVPGKSRSERFNYGVDEFDEELPHYAITTNGTDGAILSPCFSVHEDWELVAPRLLSTAADAVGFEELTAGSEEEAVIRALFRESWRHDESHPQHPAGQPHKPRGMVVRIVRIRNPPALRPAFHHRCAVLNARRRQEYDPLHLFHGTQSLCDFGIDASASPCTQEGCALCNLCCLGFRTVFSAPRGGDGRQAFERFGRGIYFSSTSSKSDDYSARGQRRALSGHRLRVMLLCDVAAGKAYRTRTDVSNHAAVLGTLGEGYDSILGQGKWEAHGEGNLNYDELVVYNQAQAIPTHLIVYEPDVGMSAKVIQRMLRLRNKAKARKLAQLHVQTNKDERAEM